MSKTKRISFFGIPCMSLYPNIYNYIVYLYVLLPIYPSTHVCVLLPICPSSICPCPIQYDMVSFSSTYSSIAEPSRAKYIRSLHASQHSTSSLLARLGTVSDRPQGSHTQGDSFQINQIKVIVTSIIQVCTLFYINFISSSYSSSLFPIFSGKPILYKK